MNLAAQLQEALAQTARARINLGQLDFCCRLTSNNLRALAWTEWFLRPWFARVQSAPAWHIHFLDDRVLFASLQAALASRSTRQVRPFVQHTYVPEPSHAFEAEGLRAVFDAEFEAFCILAGETDEIFIIAAPDNPRASSTLMRVVRELASMDHQRKGGVILHAAALEQNGEATLVLAPKHGGKTTFLIAGLRAGACMVANDRAVLRRRREALYATGIPTVILLRDGTLDLFPELRAKFKDNWMHFRRRARSLQTVRRFNISPLQLCRLVGGRPCVEAQVKKVLFLTHGTGDARELSAAETKKLFQESLFDFTDRRTHFFAGVFPVKDDLFSASVDTLSDLLVQTAQCFEYPREGNGR